MAEDSPVPQRRQQGTSRAYILDRLKRENLLHYVDAIERGEISAHAVAVQCGWIQRPPTLGGDTTYQARRRRLRLQAITGEGLDAGRMMELWLGPNPSHGSLFSSREELQAAWEQNRVEVMRLWGSHGRRPMAWWEFDAGDLKHPGYDRERSTLWRAGVLTAAERAELELGWRREFDAAWKKDARARHEHHEWAGIPHELVEAWTAERKQHRGRQPAPLQEAPATK
jgi:hypothetical protein